MAFGFGGSKPTLSLGGSTNAPVSGGFSFNQSSQPNQSTNTAPNPSQPQIDLTHLRSTTKFDQLTPDLQREIEALDGMILNQMQQCSEVGDLLPAVIAAGTNIPSAVEFVAAKLEEVETGLENDAENIVGLRDEDVKKDEGEAKCVFKTVDRMKVPRQYQVGHSQNDSMNGVGVYGGSGKAGWWNNPQTLRGSMRTTTASGQTVQVVDEETDEGDQGPKSMVELFDTKTMEMTQDTQQKRQLLQEIEVFVEGLEGKVRGKERELNERLNYGGREGAGDYDEKDYQMQLLRYVFGEVQRNLYDVADKVGSCRDGIWELGSKR